MDTARSAPRARFAYKRLIQLGSAAAALASIVGLFLTLGDHARSLFGSSGAVDGARLEKVTLERMPFRTYLKTRENEQKVTGLGYTEKDLAANVFAVDFDVRFTGMKRDAFPVKLTLERRDASGRSSFTEHDLVETLDAAHDFCGCHSFFFVPKRGARYRVSVQVFRPNAPNSEPLQAGESAWYRG